MEDSSGIPLLSRRTFLAASGAMAIAPFASPALGAEDHVIHTLPGGFDIGGGGGGRASRSARGLCAPIWLPAEDALVFSDIAAARRIFWSPKDGYRLYQSDTRGAAGTALDRDGRFVQCEWLSGRITRIEADGSVTTLADAYGGKPFNHPRYLAINSDGAIFFADERTWNPPPSAVAVPTSGVYRISPDHKTVTRLVDNCQTPGGLALSPQGNILYLSDTANKIIRSYRIAGDKVTDGETFAEFDSDWQAGPYGITVDSEGNLYTGGPGGVWIFSANGRHVDTIASTTSRITDLAFGGADRRTLYITSTVGVGHVRLTRQGVSQGGRPVRRSVTQPLTLEPHIERLDPALDRILAYDTKVVTLADADFGNDLGGGPHDKYARSLEGTFWNPDERCLMFSDIGNNRRMRWDQKNGVRVAHAPTGYANGATLDQDGLIISAEHSGRRISRRMPDGTVVTIADRYAGRRFNHCNDVAMRSDGSFYVTDPWWDFGAHETPEIGFQAVWRVSPDGKDVRLLLDDMGVPNGIAFSPDEKTLYVGDSAKRRLRAFDVLPDGGIDHTSDRIFCDMSGPGDGVPDGIKVDQMGNVYCGGAGGMWIMDSKGKRLGIIAHGRTQTNNLAFGDEDWKTLYFVSWISVHSIRLLVPGIPVGRPAKLS